MWDKNQKTLKEKVSFSGIGLHSGEKVDVDLIPSKDREKDKPIFIEMNSKPGFLGIESINKGLVKEILEHYLINLNARSCVWCAYTCI